MGVKFEFKNVDKDLATIRGFDKLLGEQLEKTLFDTAAIIASAARRGIPNRALRNWNNWPAHASQGFVGSEVRNNITSGRYLRRRRGRKIGYGLAVMSQDAAGVIFQTAGKGQSNDMFVDNLERKYPLPRGIWAASDGPLGQRARKAMIEAVKKVENTINSKLGG